MITAHYFEKIASFTNVKQYCNVKRVIVIAQVGQQTVCEILRYYTIPSAAAKLYKKFSMAEVNFLSLNFSSFIT
jgi:hypothetical protein